MNALLALTATALLTWAATAPALASPPPPADLSIVSDRGQVFSLVLDGQLLTRPLARQLRVGQLLPGRHWAEFSVPTAYGPPLRFRTSMWLTPGAETDYVLTSSPYGPQLRQVATVPLGGYGAPGGYPPSQPGNGGYYGGQQPQGGYGNGQPAPNAPYGGQGNAPGNYPNNGQYDEDDDNNSYPGNNGNGYPPAAPNSGGTYPAPNGNGTYPAPGGNGTYPAPAPGNNYPGNGGYNYNPSGPSLRPLSLADVQVLAQTLRQRTFDDQRLPLAKQALAQSSLHADELATLLKTMTFDQARIELAKFGYAHVADPQNFYRVYDAFQFSASTREVQQALGLPR